MNPQTQAPQFRFDRRLWQRFIGIAQPYFYPREQGGAGIFLTLLVAVTVLVVGLAFFAVAGLTQLGLWVVPDFFEQVAAGLVAQMTAYWNSPWLWAATAAVLIPGALFISQRRALRDRWTQWALLGLLLFLSFAVNGANVTISFIFRFIDTALNDRDEGTFWRFLFIYAGLIVTAIPVLVLYRYIRLKLGLYWREWLTQYFLDRYLANRAYYELDSNGANTEIDNPDQRITEDVRSFTGVTLSFLLDILDSVLTLISFTLILYGISRLLTVGLLVYATVGTTIAIVIGKRLIGINYNQLRLEANFRYGMVHVRDNAESIAFYQGEALESRQILGRFSAALRNFNLLILWQSLIDMFQFGYNFFTRIVPYVIVAPLYFLEQTDFGTIGQAAFAFSQVLSALSIVTNQIQSIASFAAGINRLGAFYEVLEDPQASHTQMITTEVNGHFRLNDITVRTPNSEQTLVEALSLDIPNQLLIVGTSGSGKSSLLRAIAGLWTNGKGTVQRPSTASMLFLPQKPYMLLGSLRDQMTYPQSSSDLSDRDLSKILAQVNLADLAERVGGFETILDWPNVLSLGEQQRLAFARILVGEPQYVVLDEATSALDVGNERMLYELLQRLGMRYISVGHRPSLVRYHDQVLELGGGSQWHVYTTEDYLLTQR